VYTYGQAETVLARMYQADAEAQKTTFRARLKHFKKLGVPFYVSPGKGAKVQYDRTHVFQWAMCLELSEFGLDPTLTTRIMRNWWSELLKDLQLHDLSAEAGKAASSDHDRLLLLNPGVMSKAWWSPPPQDRDGVEEMVQVNQDQFETSVFRSEIPEIIDYGAGESRQLNDVLHRPHASSRRAMILNLSEIIRAIDFESQKIGVGKD
jgi:hypothetical protein